VDAVTSHAPERRWRDGLVRVVGISQFFG